MTEPDGWEIRLWQLRSGRGVEGHRDPASGTWTWSKVPRGEYLLRIGSASTGWSEIGPLQVEPTEAPLSLFPPVPASGLVQASGLPGEQIVLRRFGLEILAFAFEEPEVATLRAPLGSYCLQVPNHPRVFHRLDGSGRIVLDRP